VTVTITGTNDAPTLTAGVLAAAEDGPSVTLNLAALGDDIDSDNTGGDLTYTITGAPSVGTASITGTTLTYNGGAGLDALAVDETLTTVVTVTATDRNGASVSNDVTVTITGTNDAPTLTAGVLAAAEDGPAVTLNLATLGDDIDSDNTGTDLTYTISGAPSVGTASITGTTLTYNGGAGLDALAVGETRTTVVTVTATDRNGASISNDVTVTITGTNDAPTLQAAVLGAQEDGPAVTLNLATLGDDIDSDNDGSDLTYTITGAPSVGTASITGTTLSYTAGTAFQNLAQGETATQDIEVTATDRNGAAVTSTVTVTLTGTNDAPEIVMQPGNAPTITVLGNGQIEVSGTVQFTDADFSNTHFVTALDPLGLGVTINASSSAQNGAVGAVTWSYVIDADDFAAGSDQTITLFVNDQFGAADQVDVTFTVPDTGNSLPDVSTPITVFNIVGEGVTAVDIVNFYVDTEGDPLAALADPLQQYPGISFTGTGLFLLNCDDPAYQFLIDGQTQTFTYTYLVNDGTGNAVATLEWTIQGSREGIIGTAGDEVLVGDDGESELLNGGAGDDTLTGGAGDDIFAYLVAGDGFDLITDFAQLEDRIGVSASAFGGNLQAGTAPTVLNTTDYTSLDSGGTDGVFIFQTDGTDGTLYWDADGGLGDNAIAIAQLTNVASLTADDFFLFI
jgi:VCBS repeat-containing protein